MRQMMNEDTICHNCDCFKNQMSRFIEFGEGKAMMVNNAEWLRDLNYIEFIRDIGPYFSVNQMLRAECYKQRMEKGLSFLEFNYMLMQSYDFYELYRRYGCNMQFGGNDQWSNMLGGYGSDPQKAGQGRLRYDHHPAFEFRGQKDGQDPVRRCVAGSGQDQPLRVLSVLEKRGGRRRAEMSAAADVPALEQIDEMDKWEGSQLNRAKEILARELTGLVHGEDEAKKAEAGAKAFFAGGGDSENMPTTELEEEDFQEDAIDLL